jgi:hypothetical protein
MKVTFIVETGKRDSNGDILRLYGIRNLNQQLPVQRNFDPAKALGHCTLKRDSGVLKVIAEVDDSLLDLFPAVGYQVEQGQAKYNEKTNTTVINRCQLFAVGLCDKPNADESILSLRAQLESGQAKIVDG